MKIYVLSVLFRKSLITVKSYVLIKRMARIYFCLMISLIVLLTCMLFVVCVTEPVTAIIGEPDMYIYKGSTINLTCVVKHSPEPPPAIYWTHNSQVSSTNLANILFSFSINLGKSFHFFII